MSTDSPNTSVSPSQFDALMRRIDDLEATVESQNEVIAKQAQRITSLEDDYEFIESEVFTMDDLVVGETGSTAAYMDIEEHGDVFEQLEELRNREVKSTDGGSNVRSLPDEVRERMLPIHQMWVDVRDGRTEQLNKQDVRAARLFGKFIKRASGESEPSVDPSYNTYSMDSSAAADVLQRSEDAKSAGSSMTVKRAMSSVERYSKVDGEPVIGFTKQNRKNMLAVDKDKFNALMSNVEAAIDGTVGTTTDDATHETKRVAEERNHVDDELDALTTPEVSE